MKVNIFSIRLFFNKCTSNITEPLCIVLPQMDPIKDVILARRMIILLGGPMIVLANPSLFSSCVSKRVQQTCVKQIWHFSCFVSGCLSSHELNFSTSISCNSSICYFKPIRLQKLETSSDLYFEDYFFATPHVCGTSETFILGAEAETKAK